MKLYTEEQLIKAMNAFYDYHMTTQNVIDRLTPIELPSNEDIKEKSFNKFTQSNARTCFEEGAKWMKEQILNQNK